MTSASAAPDTVVVAPSNPFWQWSLRVYRMPGVQEACLALQDGCGADVNLLLFCGWLGAAGRTMDQRRLRRAATCVERWQAEVVTPLRQVRRTLKQAWPAGAAAASSPALRRQMLALELAAEHVEQTLLWDLAASWPAPVRKALAAHAVAANLGRCLALRHDAQPGAESQHLERLIEACCAVPVQVGSAMTSPDDALRAETSEAIGTTERSELPHEGLTLDVQHEAARRLAALGGSAPELALPPRRRATPAVSARRSK